MDVDRYRVFFEVCLEKSFSRAAQKLFRTQPAISQSIQLLEEEMGIKLFIRSGKITEMTKAGKLLFTHVKEALHMLDQARYQIAGLKKLEHGELIISTSDTIAAYVLPDILKRFHDHYQRVEIKILNAPSPQSARHVLQYESDIALITTPFSHPMLTIEEMMIREDVVIFPKDHPLSERKTIVFSDILSYPMILLDKQSHSRRFIDQKLKACEEKPHIIMELGSIEVIKKLVQIGFGISIVPLITVLSEIQRDSLAMHHIFSPDQCRRIGLIYRLKGVLPPAAHVFCNFLRKALVRESHG